MLVGASSAQDSTDETARRVPFRVPVVALPLTPYNLQRGMADLAWAVHLPIGYEAPEGGSLQPMPLQPGFMIMTAGRTIEEILGDVVAREPRYTWTLDDGVVHLRLATAISDRGNVLNQEITEFAVNDVTLQQARRELHDTLHPESRGAVVITTGLAPAALGLRRFSVRTGPTTVLGALDAIVKAHGASSWSLTYDGQGARRYRISLHVFDGWSTTW